jgi:hypothetical protein
MTTFFYKKMLFRMLPLTPLSVATMTHMEIVFAKWIRQKFNWLDHLGPRTGPACPTTHWFMIVLQHMWQLGILPNARPKIWDVIFGSTSPGFGCVCIFGHSDASCWTNPQPLSTTLVHWSFCPRVRRSSAFARESWHWSADPVNIQCYIDNGRVMLDMLSLSFNNAEAQLPESEANDSFWPYHVNHDRKWYIPNH